MHEFPGWGSSLGGSRARMGCVCHPQSPWLGLELLRAQGVTPWALKGWGSTRRSLVK